MSVMILETGVTAPIDELIRQAVLEKLRRERGSRLAAADVTVNRGIVTLCGTVEAHKDRRKAERLVLSTPGVRALVNDVEVMPSRVTATDSYIARLAKDALESDAPIPLPMGRIKVRVRAGFVTLEGIVDFELQRMLAEATVAQLSVVRGVSNRLRLTS